MNLEKLVDLLRYYVVVPEYDLKWFNLRAHAFSSSETYMFTCTCTHVCKASKYACTLTHAHSFITA